MTQPKHPLGILLARHIYNAIPYAILVALVAALALGIDMFLEVK